jgi:hypothetical protein
MSFVILYQTMYVSIDDLENRRLTRLVSKYYKKIKDDKRCGLTCHVYPNVMWHGCVWTSKVATRSWPVVAHDLVKLWIL